jgi:hypothetical protein
MDYKYPMNSLKIGVHNLFILNIFCIYILKVYLSKIYVFYRKNIFT